MRYYGFIDYDDLGALSYRGLDALKRLIDNELEFRLAVREFEMDPDDPPTAILFLGAVKRLNEDREKYLDFLSRRQGLKPRRLSIGGINERVI